MDFGDTRLLFLTVFTMKCHGQDYLPRQFTLSNDGMAKDFDSMEDINRSANTDIHQVSDPA